MKKIIFLIFFLSCKQNPIPTDKGVYPPTIIYSGDEDCKRIARTASKQIDSLIMLRCSTTDSSKWMECERQVKEISEGAIKQIGGQDNVRKYLNTHPYKKIPCIIGDSVYLFYNESAD